MEVFRGRKCNTVAWRGLKVVMATCGRRDET